MLTAHVDSADIILSPDHDDYTWRHADALPAVRVEVLDLVRRVVPPKPLLDAEEWQHDTQPSPGCPLLSCTMS
ncbi:hypothetical protein [Planotetraspora sp. GP83]|uniref:hypothetical protein n=1 Tax=Planotetraspora sp. GP83 TaxID=3156264 RepID=UPI003514F60D